MSYALNRIVDTNRKIQKYGSNKARSFNNATCAKALRALLIWAVFLGIARGFALTVEIVILSF